MKNKFLNYMTRVIFSKRMNIFFCLFTVVASAAVFIGLLIFNTPFVHILKYLYFQVFFVFLQGSLIYRILKMNDEFVEKIIFAYGFGIMVTIAEYFLFYSLNFKQGLYFIPLILACIEIILCFMNKNSRKIYSKNKVSKIPIELCFIAVLLLSVTFCGFTLANPMPEQIGKMYYNQDLLWAIGNTEALLRNFPPVDSRISGLPFQYHYFLSIHLAVMSFVTKLDPATAFFKFSQIGKLIFLVFSTFTLGKTFFKDERKGLYFTWIFFFTSCASMRLAYKNGYGQFMNSSFMHLTNDPFGYELSMAMLFLCVSILIKQFREKRINKTYLIAAAIFTMGVTGSKGPLGMMLVMVLVGIVIIDLLRGNKNYLPFIYTAVLIIFFSVVYFGLLSSNASALKFNLGYIVEGSIIGKIIKALASRQTIKNVLIPISIPLHFLLFIPFAAVPFILWFYSKLKKIKIARTEELLIGGYAILGVMSAYLFEHYGHSEIYFIMAAIPFVELCAIEWLSSNYNKLKLLGKIFIIFTFLVATITSYYTCLHQIMKAKSKLVGIKTQYYKERKPSWNAITKYEYEGMQWLKNNTKKDDIIMTDRHYINEKNENNTSRYFYYSVFSNRQFYLESWKYMYAPEQYRDEPTNRLIINDKVYQNDKNALKVVKKAGVKYVVVSRFINGDLDFDSNTSSNYNFNFNKVFENRDMKIFQIN